MRLDVYDQAKQLSKNDSRRNSLFNFVIHIGKDLAAMGDSHNRPVPVGVGGSCGNHQRFQRSAYLFLWVSFSAVFCRMTILLQIGNWGLGTDNTSTRPCVIYLPMDVLSWTCPAEVGMGLCLSPVLCCVRTLRYRTRMAPPLTTIACFEIGTNAIVAVGHSSPPPCQLRGPLERVNLRSWSRPSFPSASLS